MQIASKHNILHKTYRIGRKPSLLTLKLPWSHPRQLKNTKKSLLNHKSKMNALTALVGKVTVEKEWLAKKLKSLGLSNRKQLVESSYLHHTCRVLFCRLISNANDWVLIEGLVLQTKDKQHQASHQKSQHTSV
ncbi:hypothetical protein BSPWISOXPB_6389 [uncultured Gammaproteobacteria bacterium]|nr:hypothetical protein BSPWISOXPB_6389 [uncultured Gammaproteobacteria bacterium]